MEHNLSEFGLSIPNQLRTSTEFLAYLAATCFIFGGSGSGLDAAVGISYDRGYINSSTYRDSENQPNVKILRHISKYTDGNVGVQDEAIIAARGHNIRYQLNFELDSEGQLINAPEQVSANYQDLSDLIAEASLVPLSKIYVDNRLKYFSYGEGWFKVEQGQTAQSLTKEYQSRSVGGSDDNRALGGGDGPVEFYFDPRFHQDDLLEADQNGTAFGTNPFKSKQSGPQNLLGLLALLEIVDKMV